MATRTSEQLPIRHEERFDPRRKNRLTELAREVEEGETVVVTRNGRPIFDLVPHRPRKGLRLEAIDEFKQKHGIGTVVSYIADDFDEPLPEDFLLRPSPPGV